MWQKLEQLWHYPLISLSDGAAITLSQIFLAICLIVVGWFLSRAFSNTLQKRLAKNMGVDVSHTIQRLLFYTLVVVVVITALGLLHIPLTAFAFLSGAIAIGVGFGAQSIINNFISGWILMSEKPVRIGDFVEIDDAKGIIESIGNRSTRIRRVDGVHLMVPNSTMLERTVTNWTLVDRKIRSVVKVGVAYGSPVKDVARIMRQAIKEHPDVEPSPEPFIIFEDFGDNALAFEGYFWCDVENEGHLRRVRSDIRFKIDELFHNANIVIAFPQRDVHLDAAGPIPVQVVNSATSSDTHR